jgi:TolB-like protein
VDIYALGVVIYEMVTGTFPIVGDTPSAVLRRRLEEPPTPPRHYVPDLDARWEAAILRCLAREPHVRFAKATDVMKVIGDSAGTTAMPAPVERVRAKPTIWGQGWRWLLRFSVVLVILLLALFAYRIHNVRKSSVPYASVLKHMAPLQPFTAGRSITVFGFTPDGEDAQTAWLSAALTEKLTTELAASGALCVAPTEKVTQMKDDLSLTDADAYDREGLSRIREYLGADLVLLGSYKVMNDGSGRRLYLIFSLQNTAQGATLLTWTQDGLETQWPDLVGCMGAWLSAQMEIHETVRLEHARALLADFHFDAESGQAIAAQPRWQKSISWAIRNEGDLDSVDCPHKYFIIYPECYFARGRACLMEKAMQSARENDCSNAYQLAQIAQCHNAPERDQIRDAGEAAVCDFLRNY